MQRSNRLTQSSGAADPSREASEARFQKLFDDAHAMSIQGYFSDGTVVYWNRASEKVYGYTAEEALGSNLLDLIIPYDMRHEVEIGIRRMFESGQGIPPGRLTLRHKDGHTVPVYSSHTIVAVPGQSPGAVLHGHGYERSGACRGGAARGRHGLRIPASHAHYRRPGRDSEGQSSLQPGYRIFGRRGRGPDPALDPLGPTSSGFLFGPVEIVLLDIGHWQGEIWNKRKTGEVYAVWVTISAVKDGRGRVTHYVSTQTDMTQRKEAEANILHLAFYDPLTQLPNRRRLLDQLEQAIAASLRNQRSGALLFIDLDNFKTLNDTLGHDMGDLLLQKVAERLTFCIRKNDTAARLGGDEFVVMLEDLSPLLQEAANQAEAVGEKILVALNQVYSLHEHEYLGSASIGITLFSQQESSVDELMKQADLAMYEGKAAGRNTLRFFDPEMQVAVTLRAALTRELRDGLRAQQFRLFYQPQVDIGGCIVGAEALVRWDSPARGLVLPGEFIHVAEESGFILPLGQWVLEAACNQLAAWAAQPKCEGLSLAVNVSACQLSRADFVDRVLEVLNRTGANPLRLKLELTESLLVDDWGDVISKMSALKERGLGLVLDDFGTGYSSLSYLQRLPLDQLKIDRSFVKDLLVNPNSVAIAKTIIVLSQTMGLSVLAEGVETESQQELLASLGCHAYQGYLFGRPVPPEEFQKLIDRAPHPGDAGLDRA